MAEITASLVKELRERTQAGMADCKNALVETSGDIDKAVEVILKKGIVKAAARAGRVASEGEVRTWVSADKKRGVIVEVNCQTDFVARGDVFKEFVTKVTEVASTLKKGADLNLQKFPGGDKTIDIVRQELVAKTGENTVVRRWDTVEAKDGFVHAYVHMGGKNAAIVAVTGPVDNAEVHAFADTVAMQVVSMKARVVKKDHVQSSHVDKQKEIFAAQLKEEGKPEASWPKIMEGKIAKWFTEITLLGQDNVVDPTAGTIEKTRADLSKKIGTDVHVESFVRFELGEGIEKGPTDDLATEVAKMTQSS
jgi:elongation factor Ts